MMNLFIYMMVYLGSGLMVFNIYRYFIFARDVRKMEHWGHEKYILYIPIILLVLFFLGYLAVGLFGSPDIIMAAILFGGSVFVAVITILLESITGHIRENDRLEAELMVAEESSRVKSSFLSSISHEMRTPMNAIIGLDTIAMKDPTLSAETRGHLEQIDVSAHHLLDLIDNILNVSHFESESSVLKEDSFSLGSVLAAVNTFIRGQCDQKGLKYSFAIIGDIDPYYIGDSLKLKQMLFCILENAVKFTDSPGTVSFSVEQFESDEDTCSLRFIVSDTGIGIGEDFLPRVFDVFSREDSSNIDRYGGSGLGLVIARNIAELMHGNITVTSKKGEGSSFTSVIILGKSNLEVDKETALQKEEQPQPDRPQGQADRMIQNDRESAHTEIDLSGRRILIAEDIEINAELLADFLDMEDMLSEHAENGQIAVNMFNNSPVGYYDAILMDLRMPVMDGLDAARTIRELNRPDAKSIPIIALTANVFEEDKLNVIEAGMNVHMSKPVDADLLYETLDRLIIQQPYSGMRDREEVL